MNFYLVDFENVNSQGLNGINRLDSSDRIIIFYSENADSMTFDLHEQINQSKAYIFFQKVDVGTKNALDFQLATYLGYLICENEKAGVAADYFVVTKDRGYSSLITYWTKRNVDITLVGTLIQSMRIQKERSEERRKAAESLGGRAIGNQNNRIVGMVSANAAAAQADTYGAQENSDAAAWADMADEQEAPGAAVQGDVPEETPDAAASVGTTTAAGEEETSDAAAAVDAADTENAKMAAAMRADEAGKAAADVPAADTAGMTRTEYAAENAAAADAAARQQSGASGEDTAALTQPESGKPSEEEAPEEKPAKRTRGRGRAKAEPVVDTELRIKVEQAVPDKDVVDLVVSYIKKYKTKLGINNALAKEFKDSKKASEIYKSIKPLIADKKGQ